MNIKSKIIIFGTMFIVPEALFFNIVSIIAFLLRLEAISNPAQKIFGDYFITDYKLLVIMLAGVELLGVLGLIFCNQKYNKNISKYFVTLILVLFSLILILGLYLAIGIYHGVGF